MRVGLVAACVVEEPHPRGERRRHIEHAFTCSDELLGQQRAGAGRALDRPAPRFERRGECQQSIALRTIRADTDLAHELLVTVEHRRGVRRLVWIDSNEEHGEPPRTTRMENTPAGSPEEGVPFLFRATPKPRSSGSLFARKPTANDGRAFWRQPTGPRDATETPAASASHPHSGALCVLARWLPEVSTHRKQRRYGRCVRPLGC